MHMKRFTLGVAMLLAGATALAAQTSTKTKSSLGPFGGALIPTGDQEALMETVPVAGLQGSFELLSASSPTSLRIVGNVGWGFGDNKFGATDNGTNILMYDAGLELGYTFPMGSSSEFRPFIGGGGGARTYDYADPSLTGNTNGAGYGALGADFTFKKTEIRLESRYQAYDFQPPFQGTPSYTRVDASVVLGLAYHFQ